jgi:class 3 adenylate cyclase/predicted ATPase
MEVASWLRSLGLSEYEPAFRDNQIDAEVLPNLTGDDLKELGVASVGHRRKLLSAIAQLSKGFAEPTAAAAQVPRPKPPAYDVAERRQLTVMFCDLVGSTALAARLDPEDMRGIIAAYHKCCASLIERNGGFVAKYMGDGVLAYFGYPQAHEHDAERAVRSGLAIVEAAPKLESAASAPLHLRVGIATGIVVVGDLLGSGEAQERGVVGDTPNLAARLQGIAAPDSVIIAEGTRKLLGDLFELRDLGAQELKGIAGPTRAYSALRESSQESRFEALHAGGLTALVGRDEELELMLRLWARANVGEGQVVLLSGEAGIGKSRLTAALQERLIGEAHVRMRYFCSPQHVDSALHPIILHMERAAGLTREDGSKTKLDKLDALLAKSATSPEDAALIAEMLSLPNDRRYPALELAPQPRRQKTLEVLIRQIEAIARQTPALMMFEDAHWADPSSLELLDRLVDNVDTERVLLVVAVRPEFAAPSVGRPHVTVLTLNRLAPRQVIALIDQVAEDNTLPEHIRQDIVERADGIPLFVEEMTKAVLEAEGEGGAARTVAAVPSPALAVPASLHASLMARLDRLGPAKGIAQIGAAIGREFSHALLSAVAGRSEQELNSALDRLLQSGLLSRQGSPPNSSYLFKHALVLDAAHGTLLRDPRRALHARIAEVLESQFADVVEAQPELLARHLRAAGVTGRAIEYWFRAGERATKRSANREAVAHLRAALQLLEQTDDRAEREIWELRILIALGPPLILTTRSAAPEIATVYSRARQLAQQTGRTVELFQALWGSWMSQMAMAGDIHGAAAMVDQLLALAEHRAGDELVLQAHHAAWATAWLRSDLHAALRSIEAGVPIYRRDQHAGHALVYGGHDPGVCGHGTKGQILALLGRLDQALFEANDALSLARGLSHHGSLSLAYWLACEVHYLRRDEAALSSLANEMLSFATNHGSPLSVANAMIFQGWAQIADGNIEDGVSGLREGLMRWRPSGSIAYAPHRLAQVADGLLLANKPDEAKQLLAEAAAIVREKGEHWSAPEIERLTGIALSRPSDGLFDPKQTEQHLRRAVAMATESGLRLTELHAATSLARLWRDQGRRVEAHDVLAPVYGWFTEGFDTPNLKEAKTLLDQLR